MFQGSPMLINFNLMHVETTMTASTQLLELVSQMLMASRIKIMNHKQNDKALLLKNLCVSRFFFGFSLGFCDSKGAF
jgi:hypothetical protein